MPSFDAEVLVGIALRWDRVERDRRQWQSSLSSQNSVTPADSCSSRDAESCDEEAEDGETEREKETPQKETPTKRGCQETAVDELTLKAAKALHEFRKINKQLRMNGSSNQHIAKACTYLSFLIYLYNS